MSWDSRLRGVPLGGLIGEDGWTYRFTKEDAVWSARASAGEAGAMGDGIGGDAVLWTMAQNLYLKRNNREWTRRDGYRLPWPHSFADALLAYCQPINPYWRDRGDAEQRARRAFFAVASPEDLATGAPGIVGPMPGVVERALLFCQGRIPMDPRFAGLVDFDAAYVGEGSTGRRVLEIAGNAFYKSSATEHWTTATLRPVPSTGASHATPVIIGMLGLLALLPFEEALLAWLLGRKR